MLRLSILTRHLIAGLVVLTLLAASPARATSLLRDAGMEHALSELAAPILRAAGLSPKQVRILVVNESTLNAFVVDSQHIFLNYGLILRLDTARSLQAVIAHEAAHIANGHLARRAGNLRSARTAAGLGLALAAAAGVAGAGAEAVAGIAIGTQSSAMRNFLAHTRAEEASADQSSLRYLKRAGIDPRGAVEVMELFRGQETLKSQRQDPYMRSHPMSRDRLRAMQSFVDVQRGTIAQDPTAQYWFERARGKLSAFKRAPKWTLRRAGSSVSGDIGLMRQSIAYHRQSDLTRALQAIDRAIALRPRDPFFRDLKGQILLENRRAADAVRVYGQAAQLAPGSAQILGGLGRAQLATGDYKAALRTLEGARGRDWRDSRVLRDLSVAYAKTGQPAMASVVTAERYAMQGRFKDAAIHAKRAVDRLPPGSAARQRAEDVLRAGTRR